MERLVSAGTNLVAEEKGEEKTNRFLSMVLPLPLITPLVRSYLPFVIIIFTSCIALAHPASPSSRR